MEKRNSVNVNGVDVRVFNEGNIYYVPIAHVCHALGIDYPSQFTRIKRDRMLKKALVKKPLLAHDDIIRQMVCLPAHFMLGWIFSIRTERTTQKASDPVESYVLDAYNSIYEMMTNEKELEAQVEKLTAIIEQYEKEKEWKEFGVDLED